MGPVSIVVSAADQRVLVLRNGVEIGRARLRVANPSVAFGTKAFVLQASDPVAPAGVDSPTGMRWVGIALPGSSIAGQELDDRAGVSAPADFITHVFAILEPGATLYVTDHSVLESAGTPLNVLNADPPPST